MEGATVSGNSPMNPTAGNYVIGTPPATADPVITCAVQNYDPGITVNIQDARKEAKLKADHAHNLRLQKARLLHHGKLKNPW